MTKSSLKKPMRSEKSWEEGSGETGRPGCTGGPGIACHETLWIFLAVVIFLKGIPPCCFSACFPSKQHRKKEKKTCKKKRVVWRTVWISFCIWRILAWPHDLTCMFFHVKLCHIAQLYWQYLRYEFRAVGGITGRERQERSRWEKTGRDGHAMGKCFGEPN